MAKTKIEWCTYVQNLWWGCTKIGKGCEHCYAERDSKRWKWDVWGSQAERRFFCDAHYQEPLKWNRAAAKAGERHRVFCMSMGDLFEQHPNRYTKVAMLRYRMQLFNTIIPGTPNLDWLLLTKRLHNVLDMVPPQWHTDWPPNAWLGFSASNQDEYTEGLFQLYYVLEGLRQKPPVCFVSLEPLLGPIDLAPIKQCPGCGVLMTPDDLFCTEGDCINVGDSCKWHDPLDDWLPLDWIIVGGESGKQALPMRPDWVRDVRDQCRKASIPFFFKQYGDRANGPEWQDAGYHLGQPRGGNVLDGQTWQQFPSVAP